MVYSYSLNGTCTRTIKIDLHNMKWRFYTATLVLPVSVLKRTAHQAIFVPHEFRFQHIATEFR